MHYGLKFTKSEDLKLIVFCDADFAGNIETRRSTSGYLFKMGNNIIAWGSQRQRVVALSTAEAEYIAAAQGLKELIWLQRLLVEITGDIHEKTKLLLDNQSAIKIIKNNEMHGRSKHIDIRFHFIREKYQAGYFDIEYICSKEQLADIFTKPLSRERFNYLKNCIGIKELA